MRMPGMNGAELLEVVQREYPDTIRLILSGQAETESVMKALGVSHQFLSKPCDAEILQGTISARLRAARSRRQRRGQGAGGAHQQTTDAAGDLSEAGRVRCKQPELEHGRRRAAHLARPVDDRAPAQAGELRVLRSREAGRRRQRAPARCSASIASWRWCSARESSPTATRRRCEGFSMDALWRHSVATADRRASHRDRRTSRQDQVAAAFLAGMLHDIGKLVLAMGMPEQYAKRAQAGRRPAGANCSRSKCSSCTPRTPTWARTWSACGACRTRSPKPSPITKIRRSRRTPKFGLPASCTCADRIAYHPDIADVRSPELGLNLEYLEAQGRTDRWNEWREAYATVTQKATE